MHNTMTILFNDGTRQEGITEITQKGCSGQFLHIKLDEGATLNDNIDCDSDIRTDNIALIMVNND